MFIIYQITNKVNGKRYIGLTSKTAEIRWKQHLKYALRYNIGYFFYNAIRKYGPNSFEIKDIDKAEDADVACYREMFWIAAFQTYNPKFGYNRTLGGKHTAPSKETRIKMRNAHLGKKLSPEAIEKRTKAVLGSKRSEIARKHLKESAVGRKPAPQAHAASLLVHKGAKWLKDPTTGKRVWCPPALNLSET